LKKKLVAKNLTLKKNIFIFIFFYNFQFQIQFQIQFFDFDFEIEILTPLKKIISQSQTTPNICYR
jgi:hypothetical protein